MQRIPWRLATANEPEEAGECVLQLESVPEDKLDALSKEYKATLLPDLQVCQRE